MGLGTISGAHWCAIRLRTRRVNDVATVEVLERVDAVAGVIERHSSWAEQHCRLHQEAYDALVAAGVPGCFCPPVWVDLKWTR